MDAIVAGLRRADHPLLQASYLRAVALVTRTWRDRVDDLSSAFSPVLRDVIGSSTAAGDAKVLAHAESAMWNLRYAKAFREADYAALAALEEEAVRHRDKAWYDRDLLEWWLLTTPIAVRLKMARLPASVRSTRAFQTAAPRAECVAVMAVMATDADRVEHLVKQADDVGKDLMLRSWALRKLSEYGTEAAVAYLQTLYRSQPDEAAQQLQWGLAFEAQELLIRMGQVQFEDRLYKLDY